MIVIAPTHKVLDTAAELADAGFEIGVSDEGRYLRAYPTTVPVRSS
jgi:hypothetical protein